MKRRQFLKITGSCLMGTFIPGLMAKTIKQNKPNFVIILADDLGYNDLGCYGNQSIQTPNIDRLATQGLKFTDFHANAPVCSPTRAALLTGRYQQRAGMSGVVTVKKHRDTGMSQNEITFAEVLQKAGYRNAIFGKWHLGYKPEFNPIHQGFNEFHGFVSGNIDYQSHIDGAGFEDWWIDGQLTNEPGYTTEVITERALRFMEQNKDRQFCLYIAHAAPHFPFQGPQDKAFRMPGMPEPMRGIREDITNAYREMIEYLDKGIGQIMDKLDQWGISKNTFLFFCSDNGPDIGLASSLRGKKGELYEGGHRVPAIARMLGKIAAGAITNQTAITMDIFPTMLSIAGVSLPANHRVDGYDLSPVLFASGKLPVRSLFWFYNEKKAMRKGRWKMVNDELYNLDTDLQERNNVADKFPEQISTMRKEYQRWLEDVTHGVEQRT